MWLDRPGSQHAGPFPRRTSSFRGPYLTPSPRTGHTPRSSSVSLVSNDSSASFLGGVKRANGSGLKHATTVDTVRDPKDVLGTILGRINFEEPVEARQSALITESDLDVEYDFGLLSVRELARLASREDVTAHGSQSAEECALSSLPQVSSADTNRHSSRSKAKDSIRGPTPVDTSL
jgi:vacuolar protein sorting-associated protein 52